MVLFWHKYGLTQVCNFSSSVAVIILADLCPKLLSHQVYLFIECDIMHVANIKNNQHYTCNVVTVVVKCLIFGFTTWDKHPLLKCAQGLNVCGVMLA